MGQKINLECGTDIRSGHINVTSVPIDIEDLPENTQLVIGDFRNLNKLFPEPVEEIIFNPFLNVIHPNELIPFLTKMHSQLLDKGILKLGFIDITRVAQGIKSDELDLQQSHNLIFGPTNEHKSLMSTGIIKAVVQELGFDILTICMMDYYGTVELIKKDQNAKN